MPSPFQAGFDYESFIYIIDSMFVKRRLRAACKADCVSNCTIRADSILRTRRSGGVGQKKETQVPFAGPLMELHTLIIPLFLSRIV